MKKLLILALLAAGILVFACKKENKPGPGGPEPYKLNIPAGLPPMDIPADNPLTEEGIALGKKLFYDPILSGDNTMSCASCHKQSYAFTDSTLRFSKGITGDIGVRNAMPLFNLGWAPAFFWDGGAADMESQVIGPITNPIEMNANLADVVHKLNLHAEYPALFKKAFNDIDTITSKYLMYAVAQFERTLISGDSRYDRYKRGQEQLSVQELRGKDLFENPDKGDCVHCHSQGSLFTDFQFRNNGLDSVFPDDKGRAHVTMKASDEGKFKTPSLRNIALTSPYMHDGRFKTLEEVLEFYNTGFHNSATLDVNLALAQKGRMSEQDKQDIIAFLKTLTDEPFINNPTFKP